MEEKETKQRVRVSVTIQDVTTTDAIAIVDKIKQSLAEYENVRVSTTMEDMVDLTASLFRPRR